MQIDWVQIAERFDFRKFSKVQNKNYLLEINFWEDGKTFSRVGEYELDNIDREALLTCQCYLDYNIKPEYITIANNFIMKYEILEKVIDKNNNLFLFVKLQNYDLPKSKEEE